MSVETRDVDANSRWTLARLRDRLIALHVIPEFDAATAASLRSSVDEEGALTTAFVLMCALSSCIATFGLLQSSAAVVIGAMLVSPMMQPIAALGFGFAALDGERIRDSARTVAIGAAVGIVTGVLVTWLSPLRNATPELLARTQPTLLDLAIALVSGLAGGYATLRQKGATAIGVGIATALMPPLATVGYGLGVLRLDLARGALLLFLTNLAAIAFAFALAARVGGVARPHASVVVRPLYTFLLIGAFVTLATPLALTLVRVTHEATAVNATRDQLRLLLGTGRSRVAQMDVTWPLLGTPRIAAVVIAPRFLPDAEDSLKARLTRRLGVPTDVTLEQIVAATASERAQAQALIEATSSRIATVGVGTDAAPVEELRRRAGVPLRALWVERGSREVFLAAEQVTGWSLRDYREVERGLNPVNAVWHARVVPPNTERIVIALEPNTSRDTIGAATDASDAVWALQRLAVRNLVIEVRIDSTASPDSVRVRHSRVLATVQTAVESAGIAVRVIELRDSVQRAARRGRTPIPHDQIDLVLTPLRPAAQRPSAVSASPRPPKS